MRWIAFSFDQEHSSINRYFTWAKSRKQAQENFRNFFPGKNINWEDVYPVLEEVPITLRSEHAIPSKVFIWVVIYSQSDNNLDKS